MIRIVRATGEDPYRFLEFVKPNEIAEVPKSDPTWLECNGDRYIMALRRGKEGCHFLDRKTRFCRIYDNRSILCRLYPFALHETRKGEFKSFTLHKDVGCQRHQDGIVPTMPLYALYLEDREHQEDYDDLVAVFNRKRSKTKHPRHFVQLFIAGLEPPNA